MYGELLTIDGRCDIMLERRRKKMASGKSCSVSNPDGVRRTVSGKTLAPRSKRKNERTVDNVPRWFKNDSTWVQQNVNIERFVSKVFME